jgi:uncharacterized protein YkwD
MRRFTALRRFLLLLVVVVSGLGVGTLSAPVATEATSGYNPDAQECSMLRQINSFRRGSNAGELKLSRDLGAAAVHHSQDMAEKNYFDHNLKGGVSWKENIKRHGYRGSPIGENIAAGHESASKTFTQWKNSSGHRRNMLDKSFKVIGIGRAFDKSSLYDWYWTTTFGGDVDDTVRC